MAIEFDKVYPEHTVSDIRDMMAEGEYVIIKSNKVLIVTADEQKTTAEMSDAQFNTKKMLINTLKMSKLLLDILESDNVSDEFKALAIKEYRNQLELCDALGWTS